MIVTMHQPEHLPWLGYFHKMARADLYVIRDDCQYRKLYFQNRNAVIGPAGRVWATVPVRKTQPHYGPIHAVAIDNDQAWRRPYWSLLERTYREHPHFDRYKAELKDIVEYPFDRLAELNLVLIDFFRDVLAIRTPMVRCTALQATGDRTGILCNIALEVGADTYLSGPSGRDYLDEGVFAAAGVALAYHDFPHPVYPQAGRSTFTPQLSTLDLIMNCGPESRDVLLAPHAGPVSTHA